MTLTPLGYLFVASIVFGVLLTIGVGRRWAEDGKPMSLSGGIFVGLVLVIISNLFFMLSYTGAKAAYEMIAFPKYEATIISFDSAWEEFSRTDSDGDRYTEDVLMHTPTLRFTDATGQTITEKGNVRSGSKPVIGSTVTVAYLPGEGVQVISVASIGLYIGLAVMLLILGFILMRVLFYVLRRNSVGLDSFGAGLIGYVVIGGSMLGMLAGMIYGVYSYFQPGSDMPLWAMLVCAFFSVVLALSFAAMFLVRDKAK